MNTRRSTARAQETWVMGGMANEEMLDAEVDEVLQDANMEDELEGMYDDAPSVEKPKFKAPWQKLGPDGKRIKHKPNLKKRNALFRKALQPKTALMCLSELQQGLKFDVEAMAPMGNFSATVTVNDQVFRGCGASKSSAKQAAAEAALVSFVKPPVSKGADAAETDDTPWKTIASFAMYKLFANWSEGKSATGSNFNQTTSNALGFSNAVPDMHNYNAGSMHSLPQNGQHGANSLSQHLGPAGSVQMDQQSFKPAKNMKEDLKITSHPVMILHQLVPDVKYDVHEDLPMDGSNSKIFTMTTYISGVPYNGQGTSQKKAKYHLAKLVLQEAFGIHNTYVLPGASE